MSALWGNLAGVIILILMAIFIGIWIWAWQARHKRNFDRMARLPMEDDDIDSADSRPELEPDKDDRK